MGSIKFSEQTMVKVRELILRYPEGKHKSALIPVLHLAQAEFDGWLSPETMEYVAEVLNIQPIEVFEVASFYSMFNLQPRGKCLIEVCRTSSCWLNGAYDIMAYLESKLSIKMGETTPDGKFTLKAVECLGSCGTAPMLQIGKEYHENLTFEKIDALLEKHASGEFITNYC
jgi:NADH-quinone oxidoreductase subunit E